MPPGRREQSVRDSVLHGPVRELRTILPRTFSPAQLVRELQLAGMESERFAKERTWPQLNL
jgi:hypothetical protein